MSRGNINYKYLRRRKSWFRRNIPQIIFALVVIIVVAACITIGIITYKHFSNKGDKSDIQNSEENIETEAEDIDSPDRKETINSGANENETEAIETSGEETLSEDNSSTINDGNNNGSEVGSELTTEATTESTTAESKEQNSTDSTENGSENITEISSETEESVNKKPLINGAINRSTFVGNTIDLMNGVSAIDSDGNDITDKINISGSYSFDKKGTYEIIYSVTDVKGNTSITKITLTVV